MKYEYLLNIDFTQFSTSLLFELNDFLCCVFHLSMTQVQFPEPMQTSEDNL